LINNDQDASAYFRQTRSAGLPKQIPVSHTQNSGQSWQKLDDLTIANPNSAVAGLALKNGMRILVLNNIENGRYRLVLLMGHIKSGQWYTVEVLEDDESLSEPQRKEFSYPYLVTVDGEDAHLVYTWDRKKIRHRYFSGAWLKSSFSKMQSKIQTQAQSLDSSSQEAQ
jgi:predicted neuraminidase